jgi:TRAP-type C4-dicarboxylate transport system permease small subunit
MKAYARWWHCAARINHSINKAANAAAVTVIFLMMFYITADVGGRYLFSKPIPGTYEISEMLMVFVVFFALAFTQASRSHIRAEMLVRLFPPRGRLIADIFTHVVFLAIFVFFLVEGAAQAISSWEEKEFVTGLINIPRYPARWAVVAGELLLCLQLIFDVVDRLVTLFSPKGAGDD